MLPGTNFSFILLVSSFVLFIYGIRTSQTGKKIILRSLAAIDAIPEAVARAAEMGKPVLYSTLIGGTQGTDSAMTIAGLGIMSEVARQCGQLGVRMHYLCYNSYLIPVGQDLIKQGYVDAGRPELYSDDMVEYTTENQNAFMTSVTAYILREKPAANLMFGATYWETTIQMGVGSIVGSMNIAGVPRLSYMPLAVCVCDYCLIGEELFAAAAYVDKDVNQIATIQVQDWIKAIMITIVLVSAVAIFLGSNALYSLIQW